MQNQIKHNFRTGIHYSKVILLVFVIVVLFYPTKLFANSKTANFMLNENGRIIKIEFIRNKILSLVPGFPFWIKNKGLSLIDFETGKKVDKFIPDESKAGMLLGAYALDSERIVCNFRHDGNRRTYHTGIWNIRTGEFRLYEDTGSGYANQISGINFNETMVISCPYSALDGGYLHSITDKTKKNIFNRFHIRSPRFSPDGSRYAFFGRDRSDMMKDDNYLIIQLVDDNKTYKMSFKDSSRKYVPFGLDLSWSISGSFIAGLVNYHHFIDKLYIWKSNGELISTTELPFKAELGWAPLWFPNEKEIAVFYRDSNSDKVLQQTFKINTGL